MEDSEEISRSKSCEFCTGNDDKIMVSVSPRCFSLPRSSDESAKMEIKNGNPYPIYFKASTSNMHAFRPHPDCGDIAPYSKVSLIVQFYNSVVPIKRHEEVVVLIRPAGNNFPYSSTMCPYCHGSVHNTKHYHQEFIHSGECLQGQNGYCYLADSKTPQIVNDRYKTYKDMKLQADHENGHGHYYSSQDKPYKQSRDKYKTFNGTKDKSENMLNILEDIIPTHYHQRTAEAPSYKYRNVVDGSLNNAGLEEICLHAVIRPKKYKECSCENCGEIVWMHKDIEKGRAEMAKEHKQLNPELTAHKTYTSTRRTNSLDDVKDLKEYHKKHDRKSAKNEATDETEKAHIMARIVKARDAGETSGTEISEISSKDGASKEKKFISSDEYDRKRARAKKKLRKRLEEQYKSTTTTDMSKPKKLHDKTLVKKVIAKPTKAEGKEVIETSVFSINTKCSNILQLIWAVFITLLCIAIMIMWLFSYVSTTIYDRMETGYYIPCFYDLFG